MRTRRDVIAGSAAFGVAAMTPAVALATPPQRWITVAEMGSGGLWLAVTDGRPISDIDEYMKRIEDAIRRSQ